MYRNNFTCVSKQLRWYQNDLYRNNFVSKRLLTMATFPRSGLEPRLLNPGMRSLTTCMRPRCFHNTNLLLTECRGPYWGILAVTVRSEGSNVHTKSDWGPMCSIIIWQGRSEHSYWFFLGQDGNGHQLYIFCFWKPANLKQAWPKWHIKKLLSNLTNSSRTGE